MIKKYYLINNVVNEKSKTLVFLANHNLLTLVCDFYINKYIN